MTIPMISPYELPGAGELPAGRVRWSVDPARAALLVHDMQRHFLRYFTADAEPIRSVVANITLLREWAAEHGVPVIFSAQPARQTPAERGLQQDMWGAGIVDEAGEQIIAELAPAGDDVVLTKWRYSAFHRTDLAELLTAEDRDQLIICGVYGHIGIAATACDAFMRDVRAFVVADAVADFSRAEHDQALSYVADHCGVVLPTVGPEGLTRRECSTGRLSV